MRKQNSKPSKEKEKGNVFDKILKENIKQLIAPLAAELLQKPIKSIQPLPTKLQTTLEIESDDFNLVEFQDGEEIILHIEFEIKLTSDMVYRVGEYHAVEQRKHQLPIHHYVIYLGTQKTKIRTKLEESEVYHGFTLVCLNEKAPNEYLSSDIPEMVIMAVLGNYTDERKDEIVRLVIGRLQLLINNKRKLKKYIDQLFILGRIRKLEPIITKNLENMTSLAYDITKDGLYIRGKKEAEAKAAKMLEKTKQDAKAAKQDAEAAKQDAKAAKQALEQGKIKLIQKLLTDGRFSQKEIAEMTDVSIYFVRKVKKDL